jgi:hypothetical protein
MNFGTLLTKLVHDDAGFIVSAELVLVSTIVVLGMIVGLAEIGSAVNQELEDVASAFGSVNQSFQYQAAHGGKGCSTGSAYWDSADECDDDCDVQLAGSRSEN